MAAVGTRLRERNDATLRIPETPSLSGYLRMMAQAFRNHHAFRGLFYSMPNLMMSNVKLAAGYIGKVERGRRRVLRDYLRVLRDAGDLRADTSDEELDRIVTFLGLVTRGWIGDASLSFRDRSPEWCMRHYLEVMRDHLAAYATAEGRADLISVDLEATLAETEPATA